MGLSQSKTNHTNGLGEELAIPSYDGQSSPVHKRPTSASSSSDSVVSTPTDGLVFPFGKNWEAFLARVDEGRVRRACQSLTEFTNFSDFKCRSFIDVGCGSGLFSYAAFLLGAERIVSFDADPFSVSCARYLHERAGKPAHWKIVQGSVLDSEFVRGLESFDIVYSWGVLHHTGRMWEALKNSAGLVSRNGLYYIALYNKLEGAFGSEHWVRVKRFYNTSSGLVKKITEWYYTFTHPVARSLLKLKNPFKVFRGYGVGRGMHWKTDMLDWLGGYPYEFATVDEVFAFMKREFPSFNLVNIKTETGLGNNWFLYRNQY